ncbi:ABC transporter permease subunit [Gulosibacter macacae]|uniref:ABC transporter permease subunit n=1 Tax=Gulosibacter macacae TaxID=2488791 RepID=A0A3P3VZS6_9MICO|nr:ABC transporter permease subunit [Gulosibacter macacae]RRJ88321.1 ABC transporter permease subunit [Gulosibacter macacae]
MTNLQQGAALQHNARVAKRRSVISRTILVLAWVGLLIPLASLFVFSIRFPLTGVVDWGGWVGLFEFEGSTTASLLWQGIGTSLAMAIITVAIMLALLIPTMVWVRLKLPKLDRIIEFICLLPLTIPAIALVVGLAPIYAFISTRVLDANSIWLSFAYVVLVLPFSYRALDAGLRAINVKTLTEAARSYGASWFTVITRVIVPNVRPAIVSATFVSIAVVLGEYTIASILARTNLQTVLFQINLSDAQVSAAVSLLVLVLTIGLLVLLDVLTSRQPGRKDSRK